MTRGVQCERDDALRTVQQACQEYGMPLTLRIRKEADVRRDRYGSIKNRVEDFDEIVVNVLPYVVNPNRRDLEKAGLREYSEGLAYVATKDLTDKGFSFEALDAERTTVDFGGIQHRIVEKGNHSQFADAFLYVVLSLKRL